MLGHRSIYISHDIMTSGLFLALASYFEPVLSLLTINFLEVNGILANRKDTLVSGLSGESERERVTCGCFSNMQFIYFLWCLLTKQ